MPSFKPAKVDENIKNEKAGDHTVQSLSQVQSHNIKTIQMPTSHEVRLYEVNTVSEKFRAKFSYGDQQRKTYGHLRQKDSRFRINELARSNMTVEQEEDLRIETEVQKRVNSRLKELEEVTRVRAQGEGFAAGCEEGRRETAVRAQPALDQVEALIKSLDGAAEAVVKANEELIIKMVNHVVRKIALKEVESDPEYLRKCLTYIIERLGTRENIKIYVPPQQVNAAEKLRGDLTKIFGELKNVTLEADVRLASGGCRVESDFGDIDASVTAQLDNFYKALQGV